MTPRRFHQTLRGRLTLVLAATTLLVLLPVVAATVHLGRLDEVDRTLARLHARLARGPAAATAKLVSQAQQSLNLTRDRLYRDVITLTALSLLALGLAAVVLPARLLRPLRRLTALVRQAEEGNLEVTLSEVTPDEVGELAERMNGVLQELAKFDRLKRAKISALAAQRNELLDRIEIPVALLDANARILRLSARFSAAFNVDATALQGQPILARMKWEGTPLHDALHAPTTMVSQLDLELEGTRYHAVVKRHLGEEPSLGYVLLLLKPVGIAA